MIKYAVANGNWSAGATWNDGSVPADGDMVYCNNHSITANVNIALPNTILTNELCPTTNVSGGHLIIGNNNGIVTFKECYADATYIIGVSNNITCTINADIFAPTVYQSDNSMGAIYSTSQGNTKVVIINGNCYGREAYTFIGSYGSHHIKTTINGNVILKNHLWTGTYSGCSQLINGSVHIENAEQIWIGLQYGTFDLTINGDVTGGGYYTSGINGQINIGGSYHYTGYFGFSVQRQINFSNPNAEIKYIGAEPNPNYYVILAQQELNNRQQYPPEDEVKEGTEYVWGEKVGTYQQPPESVVLKGYRYDNDEKEGTLENQNVVGCVTPEDVRKDVPLVGMDVVGSLVVPSVDDVREGVVFDNGSVGTLIVEGGGDRLRIADFGYYTRSTSITYIVDLTESDKPAFADCEKIVLLSLFPTLDLDNIPDKFFDDLFIQFLRYRLLVEYYRGISVNSKFTPSEPTTEIVNYANSKCEYWLNTANLFLQLWGEKYPNSVKKDRILL